MSAVPRPRVLWVLAAVFVLGHLPFLAPTLEDIDSVNFALGLHDYDVAKHQPHPPGYPVYIFLARLARQALTWVGLGTADPQGLDAHALALWGTLLGGVALLSLSAFYGALERSPRRALLATALTACAPLVWFDAGRPMSNMTGLALVWVSNGLALPAWRRQRDVPADAPSLRLVQTTEERARPAPVTLSTQRALLLAALVAGLAAGVRSQAVLSTVPLIGAIVLLPELRRSGRTWFAVTGGLIAGSLVWALPLLVDSGGVQGYLAAFAAQAGEDIEGVDMLATNPSLRRLAFGLIHTFVLPWGGWPLASVMLGLSLFGVIVLAVRDRLALYLLAASVVPYLLFHLWLQETVTTRYALPVVPAMAYAAVRGLDELATTLAPVLVSMLVAASLATTVPLQWIYARAGSPLARALAEFDERRAGSQAQPPPQLAMHHAFSLALRGHRSAAGSLPARPGRETATVVSYFLDGASAAPVWFLADPRRTDLARFDRAARTTRGRLRWGFPTEAVLGGVRPSDVDLVEIREPGWMAGDGWALTPEMAGQAVKDNRGLGRGEPLLAHIRTRAEAAQLLVGGRNLAGPAGPPVEFSAHIGGTEVGRWVVPAEPGSFLKFWDLPAGALASAGRWTPLTIETHAVGGGSAPPAAVEQFDLQPVGAVLFGFDEGWYEPEYNPQTGRTWRWSSESAALHVRSGGVGVRVRVTATTEFDGDGTPPTVRLRAGERQLAEMAAPGSFTLDVPVTAAVLGAAKGLIHLESTRVRIPAADGGSADARHLAVRVYAVEIFPLQK